MTMQERHRPLEKLHTCFEHNPPVNWFSEHPTSPCPVCPTEKTQDVPESIQHGSARFHEILTEMGALHDRKQADYGRPADPFANVRATEEWGSAAWVGAMIRATDKMRRLQTYARTGKLANEGVRDSFLDLAVYAVIALLLWQEEHEGEAM